MASYWWPGILPCIRLRILLVNCCLMMVQKSMKLDKASGHTFSHVILFNLTFSIFILQVDSSNLLKPSTEFTPSKNHKTEVPHQFSHVPRSINSQRTLHIAVISPSNASHQYALAKILAPIHLAIEELQTHADTPLPGWSIFVQHRDSQCSSIHGPLAAFELYTQRSADVFLGPVCDYVIAPVARYASVWQIPVITPAAQANAFMDKRGQFTTLTRILGSYHQLGTAFRPLLQRFNWKVAGLLYEDYATNQNRGFHRCNFMLKAIYMDMDIKPAHFSFVTSDPRARIVQLLKDLANSARIIILCAAPARVRQILLAANELNMVDSGEYAFLNVELSTRPARYRPWFVPRDPPEVNKMARRAYQALLTVTVRAPSDARYAKFSDQVKKVAQTKFNYTYDEPVVNTFVASFHEAVLLYAHALNSSLAAGYDVTNGTAITRAMWNRTFTGVTGTVFIDNNGDRRADYSLLDLDPDTGEFKVVASYYGVTNEFVMLQNMSIHWPGGRLQPPSDTPVCGFDNSLCENTVIPTYAVVSIVLSLVILVMLITSFLMYRHYRLEAELGSMTWKISWDDVLPTNQSVLNRHGSRHSLAHVSNCSDDSIATVVLRKQMFAQTGYYKGILVAIKRLDGLRIDLSRPRLIQLKKLKDIHHDHLVRFIGMCVEPGRSAVFTEYCPKGSLQDILESEDISLDWMFRYSLMHDIVKGMSYLHNSDIRSHGNLKSSNCVVDSRFVLKITDFGINAMLEETGNVPKEVDSHQYWKRKLWTAPELLRMTTPPPTGTQKGDVYSFAIIVQEIITRMGVFYPQNTHMTPKEIVENVRSSQPLSPFRPIVDADAADDELLQMMRRCWSEEAADRPDFHALKSIIRRLNKDNESGNILDNLLSRMEQYANNLESLVEGRTADYLDEKRKCEELLYQLLPKPVASQLIAGKSVVAEQFDSVTIYFSDIVGFTSLSATSTPMQVVNLLNDLYTCFDSIIEGYDVYKVETIGDAYMVVSGLPEPNEGTHASQIAAMSLALLTAVQTFRIRHRPDQQLKLRIGIHSGPVVAGIVGLKMPRYCLFGDTVNTASRMESTGLPLKIHVSSQTKHLLDSFPRFCLELRGETELKGKGTVTTYWLCDDLEPNHSLANTNMDSGITGTSCQITTDHIDSEDKIDCISRHLVTTADTNSIVIHERRPNNIAQTQNNIPPIQLVDQNEITI